MASSERIGGTALLVAAAGTVAAMAHHPSGPGAGSLAVIVHAAMIGFIALIAFGFAAFAAARGAARPTILAGAICYAIALFGHVGAATVNGFVVPALAARDAAIGHDILLFAWEANQALARIGVIATGLAFILWSIDFLRRRGIETRLIGAVGLLAGAVPAALLLTGLVAMNVAGASLIYALQAAWTALVGLHLVRGRASAA